MLIPFVPELQTAISFASNGIVIDIQREPMSAFYWNCSWWSDFNESERLFLGGLMPFSFMTIRDIQNKVNYRKYIAPLTMFNHLISGYDAMIRALNDHDLVFLRKMVASELDGVSTGCAYIDNLFHHYVSNVSSVRINLYHFNHDVKRTYFRKARVYQTDYGFKKWHSFFFEDPADDQSFNLQWFFKLFKNLDHFSILTADQTRGKCMKSLKFGSRFWKSVISTLEFIASGKSSKESFDYLEVINPDLKGTQFSDLPPNHCVQIFHPFESSICWTMDKLVDPDGVCTMRLGKGKVIDSQILDTF